MDRLLHRGEISRTEIFGESWFGYYTPVRMFCERQANTQIDHSYERAVGEVYNDKVYVLWQSYYKNKGQNSSLKKHENVTYQK